jgi:putative ABC transport system ATP-binding protein
MDVLIAQARDQQAALVLVTHSEGAAARADRVMVLTNEGLRPHA